MVAPTRAHAQKIDFNGAVAGCFTTGTSCTPATLVTDIGFNGSPYTACDGVAGNWLCFTGSLFTGTTNGLGFTNGVSFGGTGTTGSFGTLTRAKNYDASSGINLILYFFFNTAASTIGPPLVITSPAPTTDPAGITPDVSTAHITGHVVTNSGLVSVSFSNLVCDNPNPPGAGACVDFEFNGGGHDPACVGPPPTPVNTLPCVNNGPFAGKAEIEVDGLNVPTGAPIPPAAFATAKIGGNIYVLSSSPEPATLALFATGLVGLVPVVRYRRRKTVA
jgi:hypothetical protein